MDPHVRMRRIERQVMDKAEAMDNPYGAVVALVIGDLSGVLRCLDLLEQIGMIPFFDTQEGGRNTDVHTTLLLQNAQCWY